MCSGVYSMQVVLSGLSMRLLSVVHVSNCCRYGCMYALTVFLLVCVYVMVMVFAYEVSCSGDGDCGMSDVYVLKSVGERTPVLNWRYVDVYSLNVACFSAFGVVCYEFDLTMVFGI